MLPIAFFPCNLSSSFNQQKSNVEKASAKHEIEDPSHRLCPHVLLGTEPRKKQNKHALYLHFLGRPSLFAPHIIDRISIVSTHV